MSGKEHLFSHHRKILPKSVLTINNSSFAAFTAQTIQASEQLKPCRALHSNVG